MLMRLWLWLRGYVRVSITGFTLERFLNMAAFRGIYLWDAVRTDEGVEAFVSVKGFKQLRSSIRKTKTRVRILRRYGFPFLINRYRKRKLLVGGVLFFALAIYVLSLFVWRVDIVGTETLSHDEIHEFLATQGLHVGRFKHTINHDEVTRALLAAHEQIGFAYIRTRGTRTTVLLAEAVPAISIIDRGTPTHVIADREGLITNITASAGAPLANAGDVVRAGEILVSGMLQISPDDPGTEIVFVHAYAEVWARRYYPIEFTVPLNYAQRVYTGRTANRHSLQLLFVGGRTLRFPSGGVSFMDYDRMTTSNQPGASGDYPLPFVWMTTHYAEFFLQPRTRTMEQAHELAHMQLNARVMREFDLGLDIIEKRLAFEEAEDALHVQALVITNERIDRQIPIGENQWNPSTSPTP